MGSKGGDAEVEVNDYYMSMHVGVAHNVDAVTSIYYGEKKFWQGYATTNTTLGINNRGLHGGNKKEGGVAGAIQVLLGGTTQTLPDNLAAKLGRGSGSNCPGFRGLTSLFFTDGGVGGFYWSANTPYLKPVWTTVLRAPKGLNPAKALIGWSLESKILTLPKAEVVSGISRLLAKTVTPLAPGTALYDLTQELGYTVDTSSGTMVLTRPGGQWSPEMGGSGVLTLPTCVGGLYGAYSAPGGYCNAGGGVVAGVVDVATRDSLIAQGWVYVNNSDPTFLLYSPGFANPTSTPGNVPASIADFESDLNVHPDWSPTSNAMRAAVSAALNGELNVISVSADANPAHIIYECLTNTDWGIGESADLIDVASFEACGNTLFDENFGLSMIWTRQSTVEDFVNEVNKHINGVVFTNPRTGLHTMRLIRGGYNEAILRDVNPGNSNLTKFSRRVWGETTNEVVVTWTNPESENEETVSLQDLGNISMQGAVISASRNYYGVRSKQLAMQLAARELRVAASPLCTCDIELDRSAWDIIPADVIKLTWPEYGVLGLPMRVGTVDYGRIGDSKVRVTLVEDIFALPTSYFEVPVSTEWVTDLVPAVPVSVSKVFTLPAYAAAAIATDGLASLAYPNAYAAVFAEAPSTGTYSFELAGQSVDTLGMTSWAPKGTLSFTSSGTLSGVLAAEVNSTIASFTAVKGAGPAVAGFGFIGDGTEAEIEIVLFSAYNEVSGYTVKRGVLDTVPRTWPSGTRVWFVSAGSISFDGALLSAGINPQYKLLTNTSYGQLAVGEAPTVTGTISERPHLPLRPANFKVATLGFGTFDATELGSVTLTWSNRNRLTEETIVLGWTDGDTPGEAGQTTRIVVTSDTGTVLTLIPALSGTSYVLPLSAYSAVGTIRVKAYAEKDGLISLQAHEIRLMNIGNLRKTSTGDVRVIHTGEARFPVVA